METLFTPWRQSYLAQEPAAGCFFCEAAANPNEPERLVVLMAEHHLVMLNRHPYASGHLMVAPLAHMSSPHQSDDATRAEFWPLVLRLERLLETAYHPDGMNLGLNLGRAAGAGVPGHYHFHLVPRWSGDTNFMSVLGEVRLIPEELGSARERLRALLKQEEDGSGGLR
jgi:ATP adenylyltransferase